MSSSDAINEFIGVFGGYLALLMTAFGILHTILRLACAKSCETLCGGKALNNAEGLAPRPHDVKV